MTPALIRERIARLGLSKIELAERLGVSSATLSQMLSGQRRVQVDELPILIDALALDRIAVVGTIGAHGEVEKRSNDLPQIKLPYVPKGELEAYRVAGDSLLPRYGEGDMIIIWVVQRRPVESYYGREVLCRFEQQSTCWLGHLQPIAQGQPQVRLQLSFSARWRDGVADWIGEIAGQLRANQLHQLKPGLLSAVPDPLR
jgi:repressor LexA